VRLAIMQPYFFPYIGYFQLLNAVDLFVIYDNIQFSKRGWIHRNRILVNGSASYISLSLRKDSDYLDVRDRSLASDSRTENQRLLRKIEGSYRRAPFYRDFFPVVEECLSYDNANLFAFLRHSIQKVAEYLSIKTPIITSSEIDIDHSLKGQERVLALCGRLGASVYINPIGGTTLYSAEAFSSEGVELAFLRCRCAPYAQGVPEFVPSLSIIDVLMFNSADTANGLLNDYELLSGWQHDCSDLPSGGRRAG